MKKKSPEREPQPVNDMESAIKEVVRILEQLASCNLSDENCASWKVANRRIRNLAKQALSHLR